MTPEPILFHSTNRNAPPVGLKEALLRGRAPDGGLYMPDRFPRMGTEALEDLRGRPYAEVAFEVLRPWTGGVVEPGRLLELCRDAYDFEVPLEPVADRVAVMRLDRGPTASFKDFAARMMARLMGDFLRQDGREALILVATSGDTGSAVASAFHGVPGVQVCVLFPPGEVSDRQRRQMTTLGGNVRCAAVDGKFDDCQAFAKRAFSDPALAGLPLSSANSINIGRLLPQSVYYVYAWTRLAEVREPLVIVTPSGNFGNMMGAVFARETGMPVRKLVAPVNANDEFPRFLESGGYHKVEPSRACVSNAMNVGHPSNLARLVAVYGGRMDAAGTIHEAPDMAAMRRDLASSSVSDEVTRATIRAAWEERGLLLEPHGAVGWRGFLDYIEREPLEGSPAVVVETAHPAKFPDEVERALGFTPEVPPSLSRLDGLREQCDALPADYEAFRDYALANFA